MQKRVGRAVRTSAGMSSPEKPHNRSFHESEGRHSNHHTNTSKTSIFVLLEIIFERLDAEVIEASIQQMSRHGLACYSIRFQRHGTQIFSVTSKFTITSNGAVLNAKVVATETQLENASLQKCGRDITARIVFRIPRGTGIVWVTYPLRVRPN